MEFGKPAKDEGVGPVKGGKARKSLFGRLGEKYKEGAENDAEIAHCRMHRLKAAGIAVKEAMGQIYGFRDEKHPSERMQEAKKEHPKLAKWTAKIYKFAYRMGLVGVGMLLSSTLGPAIAYTVALCHPYLVGSIAKYVKHRKEHPLPKPGHAEAHIAKRMLEKAKYEVKSLRALLKPDMSTLTLVSMAGEYLSFPLSVWVTEKVAELGGKVVTPITAALGLALGTITMYAVEWTSFYWLWKKTVLRGVNQGTVRDAVKGFVSDLHPMRLFKARDTAPPKNASEYAGQIFGVSFSHYGSWIQLYRFPLAIGLGFLGLGVDTFIAALVASLTGAYNAVNCLIFPRWVDSMEKKMREGNEHLGLDPP